MRGSSGGAFSPPRLLPPNEWFDTCRRARRVGWRRPARPSTRTHGPVRDRDVGALLLLRDAGAARALHGQIPASARAGAQRLWLGRPEGLARGLVRAARHSAAGLADLRPLYWARLSHADFRRLARRPRARPAPDRDQRGQPYGPPALHDCVRTVVPARAALHHP